MSGFAFYSNQYRGITYSVYLKSLNNKYLNICTNLPGEFNFLEPEIIRLLKNSFSRGRISLNINLEHNINFVGETLDPKAVDHYVNTLKKLCKRFKAENIPVTLDVTDVLSLNGVFVSFDFKNNEFIKILKADVKKCIRNTLEMKKREGHEIGMQLSRCIEKIKNSLKKIEQFKTQQQDHERREFSSFLAFIKKKDMLN